MLATQLIVFQTNYVPPTNALQEDFVFNQPLLNTDYAVHTTPSFNMGDWDVTNKTTTGFRLIWHNPAPASANIFLRVWR